MCKENMAVVFITKIVNGKQTQEGLCFSCAKKKGIQPINQILEQTGISEDEIDDLNKQMGSFLEEMSMNTGDEDGNDMDMPGNAGSLLNFINKSFFKSAENSGSKDSKDIKDEDKEEKDNKNNSTRTKTQEKKIPKKKKFLDAYGINLTAKAKEGKIDHVIGREREIERVIQILNRRTKIILY